MKILLLSPYDAISHRYWYAGLVARLDQHDFTVVTLPARYFSWRFRGNSLSLAFDSRLDGDWELLVATSMTDLSALVGMRPALAGIRSLLYFHENQFAYPEQGDTQHQVERQMTSLYAALSADQLVFNSLFNQSTFLTGVQQLLARLPDHVPAGLADKLRLKAKVLPVPLWSDSFVQAPTRDPITSRLSIVWNHRWEYDKGVVELLDLVTLLLASDLNFEFHLIGQAFRHIPPPLVRVQTLLRDAGRLGTSGYIASREDYIALLGSAHVVLSTAIHEFQGIAVLEAIAAGCLPVVPDALAYQDFIPAAWRYADQAEALDILLGIAAARSGGQLSVAPDVTYLDWSQQRKAWETLLAGP